MTTEEQVLRVLRQSEPPMAPLDGLLDHRRHNIGTTQAPGTHVRALGDAGSL
jgi:hypothetical protein